ncbi:MAG: hypothetical protein KDC58_12055 [Cyclobacteriaceae bacterium]|nr:hypothetical protein [Cyclobacteriaceae bacterium]
MKKLILSIILNSSIALSVYGQDNQWLLQQQLPNWTKEELSNSDFENTYLLSEFINPFYLEADFNGDSKMDIAIAIENKSDHKKGFVILHNSTGESFIIGAGKNFGNGRDDFKWMDIWKVQRNLTIHQLVYKTNGDIDNSEPLQLNNTAIMVAKSESGSGVIYWDDITYRWVQISE